MTSTDTPDMPHNIHNPDMDLIGVREAARRLGVHENTIRNYEQKGMLRAARLPSGLRKFSAADVARMREEMWSQFAPATEIGEPRRPLKPGTVVHGDLLPEAGDE